MHSSLQERSTFRWSSWWVFSLNYVHAYSLSLIKRPLWKEIIITTVFLRFKKLGWHVIKLIILFTSAEFEKRKKVIFTRVIRKCQDRGMSVTYDVNLLEYNDNKALTNLVTNFLPMKRFVFRIWTKIESFSR